ncbi:MAG: Stk1 family PASTA domain-containing Ser/Thr kinase [Ruminococcaceae bacterium]|nr:Stk1 family PASTA domain-containing Ser/Thr kinase [Oscillospiraceae bacterium]
MVGSVLSNRYELLENIGAGGMAIVYKARCRLLNRHVAVKILRPEFQEDEEFLKRFTIEAQAAASLSHPNVVSVYDVGRHGKLNYIVMECIEGITLKEYMTRKGVLSVNEAVDFTGQIASALEHAHAKGIIHRDIKPHNIIITNEGTLKVTDFGLARAVSASTNVAGSSSAIGSVHYASPEQARGGFTDERSDIYSLGVVMYEMFTGMLPFDGETPVAVAMKHLQEQPVPPRSRNPQIPSEVEAIILRAMAKDLKERYASISALSEELRKLFAGETVVVHTDKFSTRKLPKIEEAVEEKKEEKKPKKKRKKEDTVAIVAAVAAAIVIISVLGFFTARSLFPHSAEGTKISVPSLLNMSVEEAKARYTDITIEEIGAEYNSTIPEGYIMRQDKAEGTRMEAGGKITVTVSRGAERIELEDYTGKDYRTVERALQEKGLIPQISEEHSDEMDEGEVIRTNPNAGYPIRTGETVMLYVSRGKSEVKVAVPDLHGKSESEARETLKLYDLTVGEVREEASSRKAGVVISQSAEAGTMISSGAAIDFVISSGGGETPAPKGTYTLRLELPSDKERVSVRIASSAKTFLEAEYETALSPITVNLSDTVGNDTVNIYIDNELYKENVPVTFE